MQKSNLYILSTRPLSTNIIQQAAAQHIHIECTSFIETEPVLDDAVIKEIQHLAQQNIAAVFTSMNAVDAVTDQVTGKPDWKIFCLGHTTRQLIGKHFGEEGIEGTADNASALADEIITKGFKKVYFFCGNQRRDELPQKLEENGVDLHELVVYKTHQTTQRVSKKFSGILFFSPSAVHSFFGDNEVESDTVLFAIGTTTAAAIEQYSNNKIIIAGQPGKDNLVHEAIQYFTATA